VLTIAGELGEPLAGCLESADLRPQAVVDLAHAVGEVVVAGVEELVHPGQRHAGAGQGADPDQSHDGRRLIGPVAGGVASGLGQQPDLVVVPDRPHRHPGVARELADGQHGPSLAQAILRR
jgi:hypothetical protein